MNIDPIAAALFTKLSTSSVFVSASRKFKHFADLNAGDQPSLYLVQKGIQVSPVPGLPPVYVFTFDALVYVNTGGDESVPPASILNPLLDALLASLTPVGSQDKQTLGGLVVHAWVEGHIETDEGMLGQQGYAIVPISIKAV
jgi:hypothetical protein